MIFGFKGDSVQKFRDYLWLFLISGFIVALDQYTKWLVRSNLSFAESWLPEQLLSLLPYMRIVYWHNTGAAFGLFQNGNLIFIILGFIVSGVIIYYYPHVPKEDWWLKLALGLQLGGALGNLIDRLQFGHVIDFFSVGSFPVFNVADSAITVGTCILLLGVYLKERKLTSQAKTIQDPENSSPVNTQPEAPKNE
jgi:signal peptidase II